VPEQSEPDIFQTGSYKSGRTPLAGGLSHMPLFFLGIGFNIGHRHFENCRLGFADDRWVTLGIRFDLIKALDGFIGAGETQRDLRLTQPTTESDYNQLL